MKKMKTIQTRFVKLLALLLAFIMLINSAWPKTILAEQTKEQMRQAEDIYEPKADFAKPVLKVNPNSQEEADALVSNGEEEEIYTLEIRYIKEGDYETQIYQPYIGKFLLSSFKSYGDDQVIKTINIKDRAGYNKPQETIEITKNLIKKHKDSILYVAYEPAEVEYTISHKIQRIEGEEGFDLYKKETLKGKVGTTVEAKAIEIPGYEPEVTFSKSILSDSLDEKLNLDVYYYVDSFQVKYETVGARPIRTKKLFFSQAIPAVKDPIRHGFIFNGWTVKGDKTGKVIVENPRTDLFADGQEDLIMPAEDITFTAHWTSDKNSNYKVNVWAQKADLVDTDNPHSIVNYDYIALVDVDEDGKKLAGPVGSTIELPNIKTSDLVFPDLGEKAKSKVKNFSKYYQVNEELTKKVNGRNDYKESEFPRDEYGTPIGFENGKRVIDGNGQSVFDLFFDRTEYELIFAQLSGWDHLAGGIGTILNPVINKNGNRYEYKEDVDGSAYTAKARFNQNLQKIWPLDDEIENWAEGHGSTGWRLPIIGIDFRRNSPPYRLTEANFLDEKFLPSNRDMNGKPLTDKQRYLILIQASNTHIVHTRFKLQTIDSVDSGQVAYEVADDLSYKKYDSSYSYYNFIAPDLEGFTPKVRVLHQEKFTREDVENPNKPMYQLLKTYNIDYAEPRTNFKTNGLLEFEFLRNTYSLYLYDDPEIAHNPSIRKIDNVPYGKDLSKYAKEVLDKEYIPKRPDRYPENFEFKGWAKDRSGLNLLKNIQKETMPARINSIYASWGPKEVRHKAIFDYNDGGKTPDKEVEVVLWRSNDQEIESGTPIPDTKFILTQDGRIVGEEILDEKIANPIPVREGYEFLGWSLILPDEDQKAWDEKYNLPPPYAFGNPVVEDIRLKAVWAPTKREDGKIRHIFLKSDQNDAFKEYNQSQNPDLVERIIEEDIFKLRINNIYSGYAKYAGDDYLAEHYYKTMVVSENKEDNILTFVYRPFRHREHIIKYINNKTNEELLFKDIVKSGTLDYNVATYKKIRGFKLIEGIKPRLQLKFDHIDGVIDPSSKSNIAEFRYEDVRIIKYEENNPNTPIPKGYVRLTFDGGEGSLVDELTTSGVTEVKQIFYDVLKGTSSQGIEYPQIKPPASKKVGLSNPWDKTIPAKIEESITLKAQYIDNDSKTYNVKYEDVTGDASSSIIIEEPKFFNDKDASVEVKSPPLAKDQPFKVGQVQPEGRGKVEMTTTGGALTFTPGKTTAKNGPETIKIPIIVTYDDGSFEETSVTITITRDIYEGTSGPVPANYVRIRFLSTDEGDLYKESSNIGKTKVFDLRKGLSLKEAMGKGFFIPLAKNNSKSKVFDRWDKGPVPDTIEKEEDYTALYKEKILEVNKPDESAVPIGYVRLLFDALDGRIADKELGEIKTKALDVLEDLTFDNPDLIAKISSIKATPLDKGTRFDKWYDQIPTSGKAENKIFYAAYRDLDYITYIAKYTDVSGRPELPLKVSPPKFKKLTDGKLVGASPSLAKKQPYTLGDLAPKDKGEIKLDPRTGSITFTSKRNVAKNYPEVVEIPVVVEYADASRDHISVKITIGQDVYEGLEEAPEGYHKVTFALGEGVLLQNVNAKRTFSVKTGSSLSKDYIPEIVADFNYSNPSWPNNMLKEMDKIMENKYFISFASKDDEIRPETGEPGVPSNPVSPVKPEGEGEGGKEPEKPKEEVKDPEKPSDLDGIKDSSKDNEEIIGEENKDNKVPDTNPNKAKVEKLDKNLPTYKPGQVPKSNDPNSPEEFVLIDDRGIPLAKYTRVKGLNGEYIYVDEDGIPLGVKIFPKTGDDLARLPLMIASTTSLFTAILLAFFKKRKYD